MARFTVLVFALPSFLLLSTCPSSAQEAPNSAEIIESFEPAKVCPNAIANGVKPGSTIDFSQVCALLRVVKNTIKNLGDNINNPDAPLESVSVNLKVAAVRSSGFGIKLIILAIGFEETADSVQNLTIKLAPKNEKLAARPPYFSERLANAILAAFNAIKTSGLDLKTEGVTMSVQFGVSHRVSGGVDTIVLAPISINASGAFQSSTTQGIVFEYGKKETSERD